MRLPTAVTDVVDEVLDRTVVPGYSRLGLLVRRAWWPPDPPPNALRGRTALVTGASSGLGKATAAGLAGLGATVHMLVRNPAKGEQARAEVAGRLPGADLRVEHCDLSDLAAVRRFAADFSSRVGELHVLVHNAGVMVPERTETDEGHEVTLATHVLGPFLLTHLLRPALEAADDSRVVFVSSGGMYTQRLRDDDPEYREGAYTASKAYARTKKMQVALVESFAEEFDRDVPAGISVHGMHPGWADTPGVNAFLPRFRALAGPILRSESEGADTTVWLAAAAEPGRRTGVFWQDRRPRPTAYLPHLRASEQQRHRLWAYCARVTGVPPG